MPHDTDPPPDHPDPNNPNPKPTDKPPARTGERSTPPEGAAPGAGGAFSFDEPVPAADRESFTVGVSRGDVPGLSGSVPRAEAVPEGEPVRPSGVNLEQTPANLEPLAPVAPASGWLGTGEMSSLPPEATPPGAPSSDIFGGSVPQATPADQSDVIAATSHTPPELTRGQSSEAAARRGSDVALSFNEPPGGSTIHEAMSDEDLPWAEEIVEAADLMFTADEPAGPMDSSRLAQTPDLPAAHLDLRDDLVDTGAKPLGPDAASILADSGEEDDSDDSSAIRLEAPGVSRTLDRPPPSGGGFELTVGDEPQPPPQPPPKSGAKPPPSDRGRSGSDLFAQTASSPEFDLADESSSPFDPRLRSEKPSFSSGQSSIFSPAKPPGAGGSEASGASGTSGAVPVGKPDDDEVDFSDHPRDPGGSSILKRPAGPAGKDESGAIDWAAAASAEDDPTALAPPAAPPARAPRPGQKTPHEESTDDLPFPPPRAKPGQADKGKAKLAAKPLEDENLESESVVLDYVAGTSEMSVPGVVKPPPPGRPKSGQGAAAKKKPAEDEEELVVTRRARPVPAAGKGGKGWLVGAAGGLLVGAGAFAGLYFGGVLPNGSGSGKPVVQGGQGGPQGRPDVGAQPGGPATAADAKAALDNGDPGRALRAFETAGADTAEAKAGRGQARFLNRVRELARDDAPATADDPALKQARDDLKAAADDPNGGEAAAQATLFLGLSHETAGDRAGAKQIYQEGARKFPQKAEMFQAALDRLDATTAPPGQSSRLTPAEAEQLALAAALLLVRETQAAPEPAAPAPPEAGAMFWKAVNAAAGGKYADAIAAIDRAKAAHEKRAKALAGRGLNPTTDPLEQIFPRCCDDLKAYWALRKALYEHPSIGPLANKGDLRTVVVNQLAQAEKRAADAVKLAADLKAATDKLKTAEAEVKTATDKLTVAEKELKAEKDTVVKLDKDLKAAGEDLKKLQKEEQDAKDKLAATGLDLKKAQDVISGVAKELQGVKLLGDKYDTAGLIAAQKEAVTRASGPNLTTLLPTGSAAVGGAGLAAGQLVDLAERLTRSEAAVKAATAKLAADTKKLRDDHAAEVKRLTDASAGATGKLKEAHAAEIKKLNDKLAADLKKADADHEKQTQAQKTEVAGLQEKMRAMARQFEADLGNAVSPSAALDLWMELLLGLRRPADADPAIATAQKMLATAPADSEDAAKANAVVGVARLIKGETAEAGRALEKARGSAGFKLAAGKPWAKAAEVAAAAVNDPLAPIRRPVTERKDPEAAARFLDAGVTAYRAGRFADAEAALTKAAFNDPTEPTTWYFLGAARWQQGKFDQAKEDFKQGGEREKGRTVSTRAIEQILGPIQGPARDALTAARP
jgi:hypothetical protein